MSDEEFREEIETHLAMRAGHERARGMAAEEAAREARRRFGNALRIQEEVRHVHIHALLDSIARDFRYALRGLRRNPRFALAAVCAVALGIGATTAVFSVVDRILFRSLPYAHQDRLVSIGFAAPVEPTEFMLGADYLEWRRGQQPFEAMTTWSGVSDCDLTDQNQNPARLSCAYVEANFLPTFGITPVTGRDFRPDEDLPKGPGAALLSYGLWRSRYAADPNIAGRAISIDGQPVAVAGVLPPDFEFPTLARVDVLLPQKLDESAQRRPSTGRVLRSVARLKPGVSIPRAEAAMQPFFAESLKWVPGQFRKEVKLRIRSLRDRQVSDARAASWVLFGAVIAVLLIACANVANLMLARSESRRREMAVRAALGAGRARLLRQALLESLVVGGSGGIGGCALAWLLLRVFVRIAPEGIPRLAQASLDWRVLSFGFLASLAAGALSGLAPSLQRGDSRALAAGPRALGGGARIVFRRVLVALQIAVSLVLLAGAGLLLRSLWNLESVPLGLQPDSVLTAAITLGQKAYPDYARQRAFFEQLESRLSKIPGVGALAIADTLPPAGLARSRPYASLKVEGRPDFTGGVGGMVTWRVVTPGYFAALGIPIVRGRGFSEEDRLPDRYTVVLSDSLARRMFPGENPLGRKLMFYDGAWFEVIGVARDVKNAGLIERADPEYYLARRHFDNPGQGIGFRRASVVLRTPVSPQATGEWVRREIAALDPALPVDIESMDQRVGKLANRPRFNAMLLALFAAMGALLAAIGLYGVMSFLVARRTAEIGVRIALGATPAGITRMVLAEAAPWSAGGVLAGIAGALLAGRWLRSLLFHVPERDPWSLGLAALLLAGVALLAAWLPSRRAAGVDPIAALRLE